MSLDIYLHVEHRVNGEWAYCEQLTYLEDQNRIFFAILGNVWSPSCGKNPYEWITRNQGLPTDISEALRKDILLPIGHHPGWVMLRELLDFD